MKKIKNIFLLFIIILLISVGFAYLSASLSINGNLSFKQNTWDVHFETVKVIDSTISNPSVTIDNKTSVNMSGQFNSPGDFLDYSFNIVNDGSLPASISSITNNLTEQQKNYIDITLKYTKDNSNLTENDVIYAGQVRNVEVHIGYKEDIDDFYNEDSLALTLTLKFIQPKRVEATTWDYEYVGLDQAFYAPKTGKYKIELWGASGGTAFDKATGGAGAYTSGIISLNKGERLFVYVGEQGASTQAYVAYVFPKTFNGGGAGSQNSSTATSSGGGATDVRLTGGEWSDFDSLKSRIMVAAGGGGGGYFGGKAAKGGYGGALQGGDGTIIVVNFPPGKEDNRVKENPTGATQNQGGQTKIPSYPLAIGQFGQAGSYMVNYQSGAGAGSGYYGGAAGVDQDNATASGSGGSSYISGYDGCLAIEATSTKSAITHKENSIHYSNKVFTEPTMIAGNSLMPNPNGSNQITGNMGNGFARITFVN